MTKITINNNTYEFMDGLKFPNVDRSYCLKISSLDGTYEEIHEYYFDVILSINKTRYLFGSGSSFIFNSSQKYTYEINMKILSSNQNINIRIDNIITESDQQTIYDFIKSNIIKN
jgi:hypothetical protein